MKLVLQQGRYPEMDMRLVAQQIEGMRQASTKWPTLADCWNVLYPPKINREQSSSEVAARFKAEILERRAENGERRAESGERRTGITVADLTGGMGIDSMAFARVAEHVDYVERDEELCLMMEHNCEALGIDNVSIHCGDSIEWLRECGQHFDVIFVDPARRDGHGRKVAAFEECTPNILEHWRMIAEHCDWVMVKASPMIDIDRGMEQLGSVREVHVVAVRGECKEVVFCCQARKGCLPRSAGRWDGEARIYAHNIGTENGERKTESGERKTENGERKTESGQGWFGFTRGEEAEARGYYCEQVGRYIYEPDAAVMKSGCFKLLCQGGRLLKLDRNTHLYTSDELMEWSGRVFEVLDEVALNRKGVAAAIPGGKAHVVTRNYPVEAAELQKRLGLHEGGEVFVIATTVAGRKIGVVARRTENGKRRTENGERRTENGERKTENGERKTENGERGGMRFFEFL